MVAEILLLLSCDLLLHYQHHQESKQARKKIIVNVVFYSAFSDVSFYQNLSRQIQMKIQT